MVSAKQRAARARFAYVMKHGGFRKGVKRKLTKFKRKHSVSNPMARRGRGRVRTVYRRVRGGFRRRGGVRGIAGGAKPFINGILMGKGAESLASQWMPQAAPLAKYGGAWYGGGVKGILAVLGIDLITGQGIPLLGNLFGGGGNMGGGEAV